MSTNFCKMHYFHLYPPTQSTKAEIDNVFMDNKYLHVSFEFIEIIVRHFTDDGILEKFWFKRSILQEETQGMSVKSRAIAKYPCHISTNR